jgi:hypothetical protein
LSNGIREILKREFPKAQEEYCRVTKTGSGFRHTGVRHFGNSEDKESGYFGVGNPEVSKEGCGHGGHSHIDRNFGISAFQTPGVRRAKEGCSWGRKVPNREIPKSVWKNKSRDIFDVSAYRGSRRQRTGQLCIAKSRNAKSRKGVREGKAPGYFRIRRFGHPGDKKSGNSTLKVPKREIRKGVREGKVPGYFGVSATGSWGDKQLKDSYTEVPKSRRTKGRSRDS